MHEGKPEKALEHFREALRLDPTNEWARQGIVEALKARYFIYSWMLRYFLWMSRLSGRAQWGVMLGGYFGSKLLGTVSKTHPQLGPWILPIQVLYAIFVILTWTADPLFNLVLRLNRFGRLALSREQITASNWLGATIVLALGSLVAWIVSGVGLFLGTAVAFGFLPIPLAAIFKCQIVWPRVVMALYTVGLTVVGLMSAVAPKEFLGVFLLGVLLSSWVANFLMAVRPKH